MADTLKELREKQLKLVADARERLDQVDDKTDEARAKELETQFDAAMAEYDKTGEQIARREMLARAEDFMASVDLNKRPATEGRMVQASEENNTDAYARVFREWMVRGAADLSTEERSILRRGDAARFDAGETRAQATNSSTAGGYLIPSGFMAELMVSMKAYGPMLDPGITREMVTESGNQIPWPTMDDTANSATQINENTAVSTSSLTFGQKTLQAWKYTTGVVLVSSELEQDSGIPIDGIVRDAMATRLGRGVNTALTTGTGSSQPNGIITAATSGYTAASSSAIVFDDVIELFHSVDPAYRDAPNIRWMFNDAILKTLRKLKDGEGEYIWQDRSAAGTYPATILGRPYAVNQAMDSTITSGKKTILFGDFSKYVVRRVREFALKRLVERYAEYDQIGFIGFGRYDGNLMDAAAVKYLTH